MRILHLESPNPGKEGDHVYRTAQPCRALGEQPGVSVRSGSLLEPRVHRSLAEADVLVLCDVVDPDLAAVVETRRQAGRLTVYEINDHFLAVAPGQPTGYLAANPLLRSLSSLLAARADAVQLSTPELAREFAHLNPRRAVFVNQLWDVPALPVRKERGRVWLGWGGSLGHREDLAWVMPALRAALARHPQLGLAVMCPDALLPVFGDLPADRFRHTPGGSLASYYEFLAGLDIGFCPLLPGDFNRCRSDVKFLELASRGVPAICAAEPPYRDSVRPGENGLLFRFPEELGAHIDRLVNDPGLRARIGQAAYADAAARRERVHAPARLAQYRDWGARDGGSWQDDRGDEGGGDAWLSRVLHDALARAVAGDSAGARTLAGEAAAKAPGFYVPALTLGMLEPDPGRALAALTRAEELAPASAHVALHRGLRCEALGRIGAARAAYEACAQRAPTLGIGDAQLGALADQAGDTATAAAHYERAYAGNPFYAPAVLRLAAGALAVRDIRRATTLLEAALARDPRLWRLHFLLGRAYGEVGRWQAAQHHLERALSEADERAPVLALLAKGHIALGNVSAAQAAVAELRRLGAALPG